MSPRLDPGARLEGLTLGIATVSLDRTQYGKAYLKLLFIHRGGQIDGRWWDVAEPRVQWVKSGVIVGVYGQVTIFDGRPQVKVERMECQPDVTWAEILPRSARPTAEMLAELANVVASLGDEYVRGCVERVLVQQEVAARLPSAPGAMFYHHARVGGLLEHTLNVVRLCEVVVEQYQQVDRNLLIASAILHDIGKVFDYSIEAGFDFTDEGRLVGHLVRGCSLIEQACAEIPNFPDALRLRLVHSVAAHHGNHERGSPVEPRTLEALVLHHLDYLDGDVGGFLDWTQANPTPGPWTPRSPQLRRELLRPEV